jgi:hypothetical protein
VFERDFDMDGPLDDQDEDIIWKTEAGIDVDDECMD